MSARIIVQSLCTLHLTASNPIPCGKKVTLKINGNEESISFGALPDSIPIGAKAIGGIGSIEMHGCQRSRVWSTLKNTINAGATQIKLTDDIMDWMAGDEIVIATTDHEHRHTEYFKITDKFFWSLYFLNPKFF